MAMNETEEDTFLAFGTADVSAYDCDIYVNSNDECALSGNGDPVIEVGAWTGTGRPARSARTVASRICP